MTGTRSPLGCTGQYTDPATGFIYLRARYYDPTTAQFLSIDPEVNQTYQPFGYADDNPLNEVDLTGLSWCDPTSWTRKTWPTIGLVAGGVALAATGVGLIADVGIGEVLVAEGGVLAVDSAASSIISAVGLASGGLATATDAVPYVESFGSKDGVDRVSCAGAFVGALSVRIGAPGLSGISVDTEFALDAFGFMFGTGGELSDGLAYFGASDDASGGRRGRPC